MVALPAAAPDRDAGAMNGTTAPRHRRTHHRPPVPAPRPLPPRRVVPEFRPIRRGGGGRHRLRRAVPHRCGAALAGLVVCTTAALAAGPPHSLLLTTGRLLCVSGPP
ncbi:hypothetical protein GCM10009738_76610 [Kitasatospora viridis]|uniref:Uncharacterized protein n=2 Tax=Kitasatospora viridis TaxID=281105 RepID=A0A561UG23_9ACTN|nr:hypothetical protein FHX73_112105 [Kitasatospora viridis]